MRCCTFTLRLLAMLLHTSILLHAQRNTQGHHHTCPPPSFSRTLTWTHWSNLSCSPWHFRAFQSIFTYLKSYTLAKKTHVSFTPLSENSLYPGAFSEHLTQTHGLVVFTEVGHTSRSHFTSLSAQRCSTDTSQQAAPVDFPHFLTIILWIQHGLIIPISDQLTLSLHKASRVHFLKKCRPHRALHCDGASQQSRHQSGPYDEGESEAQPYPVLATWLWRSYTLSSCLISSLA